MVGRRCVGGDIVLLRGFGGRFVRRGVRGWREGGTWLRAGVVVWVVVVLLGIIIGLVCLARWRPMICGEDFGGVFRLECGCESRHLDAI